MGDSKQIKISVLCKSLYILTLPLLLLPGRADAYIDPNTGGFFFTSILPFVYGLLAAVVVFWKKIVYTVKNFFSKK